jgi:choline dehydrogenase-like flavoprotein
MLKASADLHVFPYQVRQTATRWSFGIFVFRLAPRSRGRMRLTARDPRAAAAIDLALLTDRGRHDRAALVRGLQLVHRLTHQPPLRPFIAGGPRRFTSAARLKRYVQDNVTDYAHSVGTCRMGGAPDAGDVVDARTRVHGLRNVFIADASVIPHIPRANTNLTCFAVGMRAADLLAPG